MAATHDDFGDPIHYSAVAPGTPVVASDGVVVGKVDSVIDNYAEHIFDGVVLVRGDDSLAFCDAPEIARTLERAVLLAIDSRQASELPAPKVGAPEFGPRRGRLSRVLGSWRRERFTRPEGSPQRRRGWFP